MARPEKVAVVEEIKEKLESAEAVFVTEYRGLTVGQQQELRRSLNRADAEYKVFKMSLARLAAEEAGFSDLLVWLEGPTAIAFTSSDPVPAAKSLKEFSDSNDSLVLKGGLLAGATLDADAVRQLAEIEPRDVLLAKLAGAMSAPMAKLAGLMSAILRQPATAMQQLLEKKEPEPTPAVEDAAPEADAVEETSDESSAEGDAEPAAEEEPAEEAAAEVEEEPAEEAAAEEEEPAEEPVAEAPAEEAAEPAAQAAAETEEPEAEASDGDGADEDSEDSDQ
ncbi:MAG: 50S ribosomal protein L10 [Acidimicrobiia bacterium]